MDPIRFDALARWWGRGTRRSALQLMVGTTLSGALLAVGLKDAAAGCVAPGKKCKGKDGDKKKCCGGAKCKGGKCRCQTGGPGCGKACCAPGQVCQQGTPKTCINGPLKPGEICDPNAPLGCESGKCVCVTVGENTACTCREEVCFGFNNETCENTSQCCQGFCSGFQDPPKCQPGS